MHIFCVSIEYLPLIEALAQLWYKGSNLGAAIFQWGMLMLMLMFKA